MDKTPGQMGYEAYGETAGWKTYRGDPMPRWDELARTIAGQETQRRWEVTAGELILAVSRGETSWQGVKLMPSTGATDPHFYPGQLVKKVGLEQWGFVVDARHFNDEPPRYRIILLGGNSEGFWTDGSDYTDVSDG